MKTVAKVLCKCTHPFQDSEHGRQVRIANRQAQMKPPINGHVKVKCTVCSTVHEVKEATLI